MISPLLSNILLTPFDREMRRKGYQLTRYADDRVVTCKPAGEARVAIAAAPKGSNFLALRLSAANSSGCLRARSAVKLNRARCMRIRKRSRSGALWIGSAGEPGGGYRFARMS